MEYQDWYEDTWNLNKMLEYKVKEFIFESFYKDLVIHCHHYLLKRNNKYYVLEGAYDNGDYMFNAPYIVQNIDNIKFIYLPKVEKQIKNVKFEQLSLF